MEARIREILFIAGLITIGAGGWIALERFEKVPPMCLISGQAYDQLSKRR